MHIYIYIKKKNLLYGLKQEQKKSISHKPTVHFFFITGHIHNHNRPIVSKGQSFKMRAETHLRLRIWPEKITHRTWTVDRHEKGDEQNKETRMSRMSKRHMKPLDFLPESGGCLFLSIFLRSSKVTPSSLNSPPCITLKAHNSYGHNHMNKKSRAQKYTLRMQGHFVIWFMIWFLFFKKSLHLYFGHIYAWCYTPSCSSPGLGIESVTHKSGLIRMLRFVKYFLFLYFLFRSNIQWGMIYQWSFTSSAFC